MGPVSRVTGFSKTFKPEIMQRNPRHPDYQQPIPMPAPTVMAAALEFHNGCYANLMTMAESHFNEIPRLEIYGTEGTLILPDPNTYCGPVYLMRGPKGETAKIPLTHDYGEEIPDPGEGTQEERLWRNSYRGLGAADLAWALRNGRPHRCSAELGLHAMEIIHGVETSCREEKIYTLTTKPDRPEAIPTGFQFGTVSASEACLDTK